jgi:hypothetical protein
VNALAGNASQEVGNAERHIKGIGGNPGAGADQAGEYHIAYQAADT